MILTDTDMQNLAVNGRLEKWVKVGDISVRKGETVRYWYQGKERQAIVKTVHMQTRGMTVELVRVDV